MSITQTLEVPASRRLTIDVPPQTPVGASVIVQFPVYDEVPPSGNNGKIRLTKEKIEELLADESLRSITGILHTDMTLDEIRTERLAKHL
jgi:L-aminopeptidase/D-esterase-like protein